MSLTPNGGSRRPIRSERNRNSAGRNRDSSSFAAQGSSAFHANRARVVPARPNPTPSAKIRSTAASSTPLKPPEATESSDSDSEDDDDVRSKTALSLAGHPLPPLAALVDTISQFSHLQRLDLSSLEASEANPQGLTRVDWLAKAVFRAQSKRDSTKEQHKSANARSSIAFGDSLTWLNLSNNAELTSDGCVGLEAFEQLHVLTVSSCQLKTIPLSVNPLKNLRALVLNNNELTELPGNFPHLPELNSLILSHNKLSALPASLPASLPALKKLSLGHNVLKGPQSLPDFSLCLSLRDVRINDNPELSSLPDHIALWGKGADGNTAPGLELLELKDCGLDTWESLGSLVPAGKNPQPHGRKGLTQLLLKGNKVSQLDDYKERILEAHPRLRVLDNERLQPRGMPSADQQNPNADLVSEVAAASQIAVGPSATQTAPALDTDTDNKTAENAVPAPSMSEGGYSDSDDDDEAAQMAAEMRAMRRGQDQGRTSKSSTQKEKKSKSKSNGKQQKVDRQSDEVVAEGETKLKHKRGTRSGKRVKSKDATVNEPAQTKNRDATSRIEPFFESVDMHDEMIRLAPLYELKSKQAKIASGRTDISDGVLEDVEDATRGKARRQEAKIVQELEMRDDNSGNTDAQHQRKRKSRDVEQQNVKDQRDSAVASIIDVRPRINKKSKTTDKEDADGVKKARKAGLDPTKSVLASSTKSASTALVGTGTDAWGASGAWS